MTQEKKIYKFYSTLKRPTLVVKPLKVDKDGDELQKRIYAKFEDKYFETTDIRIVKFIREHPEFNTSYFEIDVETNVPKDVGQSASKVGIAKMDTTEEKVNASNSEQQKAQEGEISSLKEDVKNLTGLVTDLAKSIKKIGDTQPKDDKKKTAEKNDKKK